MFLFLGVGFTVYRTIFSRKSAISSFVLLIGGCVFTGDGLFSFIVREVHLRHKFGEFAITQAIRFAYTRGDFKKGKR